MASKKAPPRAAAPVKTQAAPKPAAKAKPAGKPMPAGKPKPVRPGEIIVAAGDIELNAGRAAITLDVANTGDRPIQVGSHYHFFETNAALRFDRAKARGCRLDIPAGTAVRFEPGQTRTIALIPYAGGRVVHGFQGKIEGAL